ncbi:PREDICTED: UDP-glycosyltransferase 90A2 [Tarenaya hassleriana]|uniref:UDP-glycosyltransferase 90A2 n=1 Tax=Tarenaya hassleriana TaxID=28532 RepID=UPI00053C7629|nr:PREDICTED: UDP-glycosyltransferase 90A2 [Tarenaya hassleriana]
MDSQDSSTPHVVLFPYMSKGHIMPMLQLAHLLLRHRRAAGDNISVTVFTTTGNRPFVSGYLSDTTAKIIDIPFPQNIPEIPPGVESTDKLPSMSLYVPFTRATVVMQPEFERALGSLPRVSFMVSDGFLWWTLHSARKLGFPRLVFYGMSCHSSCIVESVFKNRILSRVESETEQVSVPEFPWIKVAKCDFDHVITDPNLKGPEFELIIDHVTSTNQSDGIIFNTFDDLEPTFLDFYKRTSGLNPWTLGPLCLAERPRTTTRQDEERKSYWIQWLDQKLDKGCHVLYVAFGTQAEISRAQLLEIAAGLEESKVNFLWVVREKQGEGDVGGEGFEERVMERGLVVREWVDQREILGHESVKGFLSHCGWNSTLDSVCAKVPILAMPMMAEQPLNAKLAVEELKVAERVKAIEGFVGRKEISEKVKELMEGEIGKELKKIIEECGEMAKNAMEEEIGSSWKNLNLLITELCD